MSLCRPTEILKLAKDQSKIINKIHDLFPVFAINCEHAGMIKNEILPYPARCFHDDAPPYNYLTNCRMSSCPLLNLNLLLISGRGAAW